MFDDEVRSGVGWRKGVPTYSRGGGFWELLENPVSDDEVSDDEEWRTFTVCVFVCFFVCLFICMFVSSQEEPEDVPQEVITEAGSEPAEGTCQPLHAGAAAMPRT